MKKYKNNYPMYMNITPSGSNMNGYEPYNGIEVPKQIPRPNPMPNPMYMPKGIQRPDEDEDNTESDIAYMKEMYPDTCKRIQCYIDEACDKMEYEGSMMYDRYPDKVSIDKMTDHICECIQRDGIIPKLIQEVEDVVESKEVTMQIRRDDVWPRDLVKLLLLNELFGRRRNRYGTRGIREPYGFYEPYEYNYHYSPFQNDQTPYSYRNFY